MSDAPNKLLREHVAQAISKAIYDEAFKESDYKGKLKDKPGFMHILADAAIEAVNSYKDSDNG